MNFMTRFELVETLRHAIYQAVSLDSVYATKETGPSTIYLQGSLDLELMATELEASGWTKRSENKTGEVPACDSKKR